jgi:hypothetical protein
VLFAKHAPLFPSARRAQHPFAAGHWLLDVQDCAHTLLPVPSLMQAEPAAQQFAPQAWVAEQHAPATQVWFAAHVPSGTAALHGSVEQTQFRNADPAELHAWDPPLPFEHAHAWVSPGVQSVAGAVVPLLLEQDATKSTIAAVAVRSAPIFETLLRIRSSLVESAVPNVRPRSIKTSRQRADRRRCAPSSRHPACFQAPSSPHSSLIPPSPS